MIEEKHLNQTTGAIAEFGDVQREILGFIEGVTGSRAGHWCWHCAGWLVTDWASERGGGGRKRRRKVGKGLRTQFFRKHRGALSSIGPSVLSSLAW